MAQQQLVGTFDWVKGGSMESYSQQLTLRADGTGSYVEKQETSSESWTRSGEGRWRVENDTLWLVCPEMRKDTKLKRTSAIGLKDEVKTDYNIAVDVPVEKLRNAPPSGPNAPKSRWRRIN